MSLVKKICSFFVMIVLVHPTICITSSKLSAALPEPTGKKSLQELISKKVHDIDHVNFVLSQYKKLKTRAALDQRTRLAFENWLLRKSYFIGSKRYNHDLVFTAVPQLKKNARFSSAFRRFVSTIQSQATTVDKNNAPAKNISILFCGSYGGGHRSPATALKNYFEACGHTVQFIDVDTYVDMFSPTVQGYKRSQLYPEVFQKAADPKRATQLRLLIEAKHKPKNRKFLGAIKEELIKFNPDHIFSVAHHRPQLAYLSYQLNCPMTIVGTDYLFNRNLYSLITEQSKLKKPLVNFTTLTGNKCFLKELCAFLGRPDQTLPTSVQNQLRRLDFPVRDSFRAAQGKEIAQIRKEMNIPEKAIVCKVAVGQNAPAQDILKIVQQLTREQKSFKQPLYLFVICGKNEELKQMLEKKSKASSKLLVHACGFLEEKEMAQIDRISSVWITKPGGSTCAELIATQKQMLYLFATQHTWELPNTLYLKKLHLAEEISSQKSLIKQIVERHQAGKRLDTKKLPLLKWKEQANIILNG